MRLSPRVYVPVVAAILMSALIGCAFLWQIQLSVASIESGFKATTNPITSTIAPLINRTFSGEDQTQAMASLKQGELFELQGKPKEAEDAYRKSVDSGGGVSAVRKLAALQLKRREFDSARATTENWKRLGGDEKETTFFTGLIALHSGQASQAKRIFDSISASPKGQYGLGLTAIAQSRHDDAKQALAIAAKDGDASLKTQASSVLSAYEEFALFPESPQTHLLTLLGRALAQVNECEIALPLLTDVISQQDHYRDAWMVKGYCEFSTERTKDALASLEHAYALDPQKPEIQYFLARTHYALGDIPNAITFLQYAIINGFPDQRAARQLLAQYALESNNPAAALDALAAVTQQAGADLSSFQAYVSLALKTPGAENDGYLATKRALQKWPNEPAALTMAAQAAAVTNHVDEARQLIERTLSTDPANQAALDLQKKINDQIGAPANR